MTEIRKTQKIKETIALFFYSVAKLTDQINKYTFKRYIYLYYFSKNFLIENQIEISEQDEIDVTFKVGGDIVISDYDEIIQDFISSEYITGNGNDYAVNKNLIEYLDPLLEQQGRLLTKYKEIFSFVSLLRAYDDQLIFTIFFSEPSFEDADKRNDLFINSGSSRLSKLLSDYKKDVTNKNVDGYDVLACWMNYILKGYYSDKSASDEKR